MKNTLRKIVNKLLLPHSQLVYAQSGEDIILANLFYKLNIDKPVYLDIGANHPAYISNTYYFYLRGSRGVCIEPNPVLYKKFKQWRPHDIVLNIGIGINEQKEADFYLFPDHAHGLSTFSEKEAKYWQETGIKKLGKIQYEKVIKVPLQTINTVIRDNFGKSPDFISIDVEGLDLQILQTLDYELYRPTVICVETLYYDEQQKEHKRNDIIDYLSVKGYTVHADTHVNTLFIKNDLIS